MSEQRAEALADHVGLLVEENQRLRDALTQIQRETQRTVDARLAELNKPDEPEAADYRAGAFNVAERTHVRVTEIVTRALQTAQGR